MEIVCRNNQTILEDAIIASHNHAKAKLQYWKSARAYNQEPPQLRKAKQAQWQHVHDVAENAICNAKIDWQTRDYLLALEIKALR